MQGELQSMSPSDASRLFKTIDQKDNKKLGDNLEIVDTRDEKVIILTGKNGEALVGSMKVATGADKKYFVATIREQLSSRIVDTLIALRSPRKIVSCLANENYSADSWLSHSSSIFEIEFEQTAV
ncbi:MAG: hypothetical protein IPO31_23450 [Candidatus Obscuribacter sp.]|nr:hypothetical protein [Candidatus Obscuribacter sp.]